MYYEVEMWPMLHSAVGLSKIRAFATNEFVKRSFIHVIVCVNTYIFFRQRFGAPGNNDRNQSGDETQEQGVVHVLNLQKLHSNQIKEIVQSV